MSVSKRLRYEVFRRDDFTCRYCGAKAPDVQLRPDHVVPVALGGTDDPSNLVTSCDACNSGKTSTTPDAPVVADVSADALRWSRALAVAAAQMRGELAGRQEIYEQVDEWWAGWTYGGERRLPLPRPGDWRSSVDSFLAAGLPLDVLRWCIDKAMASKARPEQTWRYMCGIAWRKVSELQEAARSIASGPDPGDGDADDEEDSREDRLLRALGLLLAMIDGGRDALRTARDQIEANPDGPPDYSDWYCLAVGVLAANESAPVGSDF